jgi:hypothetical protein
LGDFFITRNTGIALRSCLEITQTFHRRLLQPGYSQANYSGNFGQSQHTTHGKYTKKLRGNRKNGDKILSLTKFCQ